MLHIESRENKAKLKTINTYKQLKMQIFSLEIYSN